MLLLTLIEDEKDRALFEELYEKYKTSSMCRAIKMLGGNKFEADEAFQTAWIQIAQNIDKLRSTNEHAISTYILKTVEYKAIDVALGNKKWQERMEKTEKDKSEYISEDLFFTLCSKESEETIYNVLCGIDETYRDVLLFYFLDGLSVKEIASNMGIKEKTAWTKLYRGKQILAEELRKAGIKND